MRVRYAALFLVLLIVPLDEAHAVCTPTVQWVWDGDVRNPTYPRVCNTPIVVQLTDDNGDGQIDFNDVPDVVFVHWDALGVDSVITALDGSTGAEHFTTPPSLGQRWTGLAAGDIDGDGIVEFVTQNRSQLLAFEHTGTPKWTSGFFSGMTNPAGIADLDQDGMPEIYIGTAAGSLVFNSDGTLRWQGTVPTTLGVNHALDLIPSSPGLELLAGSTVHASDGTLIWTSATAVVGWTGVADFDGDGDPEIVVHDRTSAPNGIHLLDHLGNTLGPPHFISLTRIPLSHPTIADVDGDGTPEVIVTDGLELQALQWSGTAFTVIWNQAVSDASGTNGMSAYDFDGDGAAEVVYSDETAWYILDGTTGTIVSEIPFSSATWYEIPIIADIDNDCVTEIVVAGCRDGVLGENKIIAYECDTAIPARPIWNQYGYHVTNVNDDGTIPQFEQPSWQAHNSWLGQVENPGIGGPVAEAGPDIQICAGATSTLDASASLPCDASGLEYQWLDGATVICNWSTTPTCDVTPSTTTTYTLEVSCLGNPSACVTTDTVTVIVESIPVPIAGVPPIDPLCEGDSITIDASSTDPNGCLVPLEFQFSDGATVLQPWSTTATYGPVSPLTTTTYTVEIRCSAVTGCVSTASQDVIVVPLPTAVAGSDESVCEMRSLTLDASGSTDPGCPGGLLYEWRDGATIVRPASPDPTWSPPTVPAGTTTYTVAVSCASPPNCESSDDVNVEVRSCPLAVHFGSFDAVWKSDGGSAHVLLSWTTLMEEGTLGFRVERVDEPSGSFTIIGDWVAAQGPYHPYTFRDDSAEAGTRPWYRVVEFTGSGRGDATPSLQVREWQGHGKATGGRERSRTRRRVR